MVNIGFDRIFGNHLLLNQKSAVVLSLITADL